MATFDRQKFAAALKGKAFPPFGRGVCAAHVRMALEEAGLNTTGHPYYAKDWGPTLVRLGFVLVAGAQNAPWVGDVAVIQGTSTSAPGHIEGFDGKNWTSDFVQPAFWPGPSYRAEKPAYATYRWPY